MPVISKAQINVIPLAFNRNNYMGQLEGGLGVSQSCACNCKYHRSVSKKEKKKRRLKHPILVTEIVIGPLHFTLSFLFTLHSVYFQMGFMFDTMPSLSFLPQVTVSLVLTFDAVLMDFPGGSDSKASVYNVRDLGSIPGLGRFPGEGNGNPLQYSSLENPTKRSNSDPSIVLYPGLRQL